MKDRGLTKASKSIGLPLCPQHGRRSGIYCLLNTQNNHKYIGQASSLASRKKSHFYELNRNRHGNKYLQNAYNLYNGCFIFVVLEFVAIKDLDTREQHWIDTLKPEYNIILDISRGFPRGKLPDRDDDYIYCDEESFKRPEWHRYVYGGAKNPRI